MSFVSNIHAHTSTLKVSSLGSLDADFGAGISSSATSVASATSATSVAAEALLLRVGILQRMDDTVC